MEISVPVCCDVRHIRTFVGYESPKPEQRNIMDSMRVPEIHGFVNSLRTCNPSTENHEHKNHVMAKLYCAIFHEFRAFWIICIQIKEQIPLMHISYV